MKLNLKFNPFAPSERKKAQRPGAACSVLSAFLLLWAVSCSAPPAPTASPLPPASPTPTLTPTSTAIPPTLAPSPSPTASPLPIQLCSPLAVQPLEEIRQIITQPFLMPRVMDDGSYKDDGHHGLDLGYYTRDGIPFTGTEVQAALPGTIAAIYANRPPYGDTVLVETPYGQIPPALLTAQTIPPGNSLYSLYAHLQNLQPLRIGDSVACGETLAQAGLTGYTGGPHLHYETRWGPAHTTFEAGMAYYQADTTEEERANYQTWRMSGIYHLFDPLLLLSP